MEHEKLTWDEISKEYHEQWVELIDYDWPEGTPYPRAGVVRAHDKDRKKFHALVKSQTPAGSALLFVGAPSRTEGVVHNNLVRVVACK